jgi:hypothetical protein
VCEKKESENGYIYSCTSSPNSLTMGKVAAGYETLCATFLNLLMLTRKSGAKKGDRGDHYNFLIRR